MFMSICYHRSVCLAAQECRDFQLVFFLHLLTWLLHQSAMIIELAASRRVELAVALATWLGLAQAWLWRLSGMILFLPAGKTLGQALEQPHRATILLLLNR